jgi:hypothetical protein
MPHAFRSKKPPMNISRFSPPLQDKGHRGHDPVAE